MKFNIAICDDEINIASSLKNQVEQFFSESEHTAEVSAFSSAEAFLFDYEENRAYDILLLDVEMKNMDGIQLAKKLRRDGYIAVTSDTTYSPDAASVIIGLIAGLMVAFMWFMAIVFLALFIGLCTNRTIGAFKGDMAIMRSMGISVKVIKTGMYVRMLISLIPAYILVIATAVLIFTTPKFNEFFTYLYPWQYGVIFVGMLILTLRVTHTQVKKLFGESVKKSLKGGVAE